MAIQNKVNKIKFFRFLAIIFCLAIMINFSQCACDCASNEKKLETPNDPANNNNAIIDDVSDDTVIDDVSDDAVVDDVSDDVVITDTSDDPPFVPSQFQESLVQYSQDNILRAEDGFHLALRNGSNSSDGNSYFLNLYYTDHISYLDYFIKVPGDDTFYMFKSFDDSSTFRVLHVSGIDDTHVEVVFNRDVKDEDIKVSNFNVENNAGGWPAVLEATCDTVHKNIVLITMNPQEDSALYTLTASKSLRDSNDNAIGDINNFSTFSGFADSAVPEVHDAYMRTSGQVQVVFTNTPVPAGSYTASLKLDGLMRWKEDDSDYTYANVISIHNYGFLIALEKSINIQMSSYNELLEFSRLMGENLKIIGQPVIGKQGLDRRRPMDTFYLTKLYELTEDKSYYDQALFNFDNEINVFEYDTLLGGEAWAKQMIDIRKSLTGFDAGFYLYSSVSIAMIDPLHPGVKEFSDSCASYVTDNDDLWIDVEYYGYNYTRLSVGAICFYLTELIRVYPDLKEKYSASITSYINEIKSWQTSEGYFEDSDGSGFYPQTTAYCLLALKGAGSEFGVEDNIIQATVDYLSDNYIDAGMVTGGWYYNNDPNEPLYNEEISELIWALSW